MGLKFVKDKEVEFIRGHISDCFEVPDLFYDGIYRLVIKGIVVFNIIIVLTEIDDVIYELLGSDLEDDREEEGFI